MIRSGLLQQISQFARFCTILSKTSWWADYKGQTEYLYGYVFLMISIHPVACSLLVIIVTVLHDVREGYWEEGEIHGDPLGCMVQRWDSVLSVQGDNGHVDWVPPGKLPLLVQMGCYRATTWEAGALEDSVNVQGGKFKIKK